MQREPRPYTIWSLSRERYAEGEWIGHRFVRATDRHYFIRDGSEWEAPIVILPRRTMEANGKWQRRGEWWRTFHTEVAKMEIEALQGERKRRFRPELRTWEPSPVPAPIDPRIALLDLPRSFTRGDVILAFRRLAKRLHPDAGGDPAKFRELVAAKDYSLSLAQEMEPAA